MTPVGKVVDLEPGEHRGSGPERRRWKPSWFLVAALAVAIASALYAVLSGPSSERRAIREMPREERAALLSRTVTELREFCRPGRPDALADHCRELASFASRFDDCQGECEALVRRELIVNPTR
jgi:hypothetical protein